MTAAEWVWQLVDLAAAQAAGDAAGLDAAFERLRAAGREPEVEEAILQSYLFLGFPSAIEAFRRWRTHGVAAPEPAAEDFDAWVERGERTCATVYGDHYERLRQNVARFHPDLDRWMVMEGYGKVLSRPTLSLDVREMLIVAMLVVQGANGRRQLRSHLQGALNAGVEPGDVERTIRRAAAFAPPENFQLALTLWNAVRDG
ncbi:MAG: carboxymuconolactone decarboxylase family protein [Gemmatimonadales bacterium]